MCWRVFDASVIRSFVEAASWDMLANVQGLWMVICEQVVPHWLVFSIFEMALSLFLPVFVIAMLEYVSLFLKLYPNFEFCAKTLVLTHV